MRYPILGYRCKSILNGILKICSGMNKFYRKGTGWSKVFLYGFRLSGRIIIEVANNLKADSNQLTLIAYPLSVFAIGLFLGEVNCRKRFCRILKVTGIETKGLHSLRHTFATNLVNGIKQSDGTIKSLPQKRQVADLLGHSTSEITERYYVKKDTAYLSGITDGFEM